MSLVSEQESRAYEEEHVHSVYQQIAAHFSSTRYKVSNRNIPGNICSLRQPWPIVDAFLRQLAPGSAGLDVGCGNGKYLAVQQDIFVIASDRST